MVHISNEVKVLGGISQGCVYNFSPKPGVANHYFVVLNKNPKTDEEICLAPFTSKSEKVLKFIEIKGLDQKTFVKLQAGECGFLPIKEQSGIDCNRLVYVDKKKLVLLIDDSDGSCNYPMISEGLLQRVLEGVRSSRMVKPSAIRSIQ